MMHRRPEILGIDVGAGLGVGVTYAVPHAPPSDLAAVAVVVAP